MKKFKILSLVVVSTLVFASQTASAMVNFGVKGGLGVSLDRTDAVTGSIPSYGYMGGVSADFGMGPIGVEADVFYVANKTRIGADSDNYGEVAMNSILVPVMAKFSLLGVMWISGGGYWNYGFGDVTSTIVSAGTEVLNIAVPLSDTIYAASSFGAIGGVGVGIPLGMMKLVAEGRVRYGFTDLDTSSTTSVKTMAVDLLVGLVF